jgi:hypothetical protein
LVSNRQRESETYLKRIQKENREDLFLEEYLLALWVEAAYL